MNFWSDRISHWAKVRPASVVFSDSRDSVSFAALDETTSLLRNYFNDRGFPEGDRIATILTHSARAATMQAAFLRSDLAPLGLPRKYNATTLSSIVTFVQPRALIVLKADAVQIQQALVDAGIKFCAENFPSAIEFTDDTLCLFLEFDSELTTPKELRWLLQTSGSTGAPRVVMIGKENLEARARGEVRDFNLSEGEKILCNLPFTHDLGLNQFLTTIAAGTSLTIQNRPFISSLAEMLSLKEHVGITGTPLMWLRLMNDFPGVQSSLRYLTVSGASLEGGKLEELARFFPRTEIIRTYGQSETFRTLLNRDVSDATLGTPIDGVAAFLVDDADHACTSGMAGELIHQGEGSMLGYLGDVASTEDKLFRPGIRTGDIFVQSENGTFDYVGRRDDMIKRFEARMHLGEVEALLLRHPAVERVVVLSKPALLEGDIRQNLLCAFVVLRGGADADAETMIRFCKSSGDPLKVPDIVKIVSSFPVTESYKVDRVLLKSLWTEGEQP